MSIDSQLTSEVTIPPTKNGNVAKNGWWIIPGIFLNCMHQLEEEAGSAGEQPASNTTEAYTMGKQPSKGCFLYATVVLSVSFMAKENSPLLPGSSLLVTQVYVPLDEVNAMRKSQAPVQVKMVGQV